MARRMKKKRIVRSKPMVKYTKSGKKKVKCVECGRWVANNEAMHGPRGRICFRCVDKG